MSGLRFVNANVQFYFLYENIFFENKSLHLRRNQK